MIELRECYLEAARRFGVFRAYEILLPGQEEMSEWFEDAAFNEEYDKAVNHYLFDEEGS
jgi:hypothetical protein